MAFPLQNSPFVSVSGESQRIVGLMDVQGAERSLDYLGKSTAGELYWNNSAVSLGLVFGSSENETAAIVQRLMASHMKDPEAQVLVLHTDHFSIRGGPCSLLNAMWGRTRVLVSPHAVNRVVKSYASDGALVAPIVFTESSVTLRHIQALFTPPEEMQGASSILGTIQLIISQLEEPFDLQRFIELVDQEKWSEDGANFMALRQTLLTKLLSPRLENVHEGKPWRITLVDLTDSILWSTALDSAIMDVALCDFISSTSGRKMIVFSSCQQYLTHNSNLTKSLEAIAALGNDRPTSVILSTTDVTVFSSPLLNSVDYVILGLTRSLLWSALLQQHFPNIGIPKTQSRSGQAMIWSPGSASFMHGPTNDTSHQSWDDATIFIDIEQLKQSMLITQPDSTLAGSGFDEANPNGAGEPASQTQAMRQEMVSAEIPHGYRDGGVQGDEEEGIVLLDKVGLDQLSDPLLDGCPSIPSLMVSANEGATMPRSTSAFGSPPARTDQSDLHAKFTPLISIISALGDGNPGTLVDYVAVKRQIDRRREELLALGWTVTKLSKIVRAAREENLVESIEDTNGNIKLLALLPVSPDPERPTTHQALDGGENIFIGPEPLSFSPGSSRHEIPTPTTSKKPAPSAPVKGFIVDIIPYGKTRLGAEAMRKDITDTRLSKCNPSEALSLAFKQHLNSIFTRLTNGLPGAKARVDELTRLLRLEYPWAKEEFLLSIIENAEDANVLTRERDGVGIEWACLRSLDTSDTALPPDHAENIDPRAPGEPKPVLCNASDISAQLDFSNMNDNAGKIETPSTLEQIQTVGMFEPLITCISRLGGKTPDSQVPYNAVKQDMNKQKQEIANLGWSSFGMLMDAAYKAKVVEPIRKKPKGKLKFLRLITQPPRPPLQVKPAQYPLQDRPTTATMSSPPARKPLTTSSPISPPAALPLDEITSSSSRIPVQNRPLQLISTTVEPSYTAFEHPLIISAILELTGGAWNTKVTLADLKASLRRECFGAEAMVLPLVFQAKNDGMMMDETDAAGIIWVRLRSLPYIGSPAPSRHTPSPSPDPVQPVALLVPTAEMLSPCPLTRMPEPLTPQDYPLDHHGVVPTILKLTGGRAGEKIRVEDLATLLAHDFPCSQSPWYRILQAQEKGVLGREMDTSGVAWSYLKPPHAPVVISPPSGMAILPPSSRRHVPQSGPSPLAVEIPSDRPTMPAHRVYPRLVVSAIQQLTSRAASTKVRLNDLTASMQQCYPGAEAMVAPLIFQAKEEGILLHETDKSGAIWVWIDNPTDVGPSIPPNVVLNTSSPLPSSVPATTKRGAAVGCSPKHHAVVTILLTITGGTPRKKVRMDEWISSLRREYPSAREEFLLSLIAKAEEDGVVTRGKSQDGVEWVWLNSAEDIQAVPERLDPQPAAERHEVWPH